MNMCLLSMLMLTIGSAFLAGLATFFKRQVEVDALNIRIKKMKTTLEKLDVEHRNSIAYYEGMREEITNYATERDTVAREIEDLEKQVAELKEGNLAVNSGSDSETIAIAGANSPKLLNVPAGDNGDGVEFAQTSSPKKKKHKRRKSKSKIKEVEILNEQNEALEKEITELKDYQSKVAALEAKMDSITKKIDAPNTTIIPSSTGTTPIKKTRRNSSANNKTTRTTLAPKLIKQDSSSVLKRINRRRKEVDFETIGFSAMGRKDDLQKINGIEPFIEKKLNALGIYRFSQLANFNEDIAKKISNLIEMENAQADMLLWSESAKSLTS